MPRLAAVLLLMLCACTAVPVVQPPPARDLLVDVGAADFPGASRLLDGFDAPTPDRQWQTGDRVLFGLKLRKGDEVHRWLLLLDVALTPEPLRSDLQAMVDKAANAAERSAALDVLAGWNANFGATTWPYTVATATGELHLTATSAMLPVTVKVFDADGGALGSSQIRMPPDLLGHGVMAAADLAVAAARQPAPVDAANAASIVPQVEATLAIMSLLGVVQQDDVLAPYFWQVIEKPGLWSVLSNLGVAATVSMQFDRSVEAATVPLHLPPQRRAVTVPLRIDVNGEAALFADVLATGPSRPLALCGGMVAASAHHPSDPDLHFDLVLLAARLGRP